MRCFACGQEQALAAGERVGFRDECSGCGADLHACRNCRFYDPSAYNECRETQAERVDDRERANRCDYFAPGAGDASGERARQQETAKGRLDALFKKP